MRSNMAGLGGLLDALDAFRDDAASGAGKTGKLARAVCDGYAGNPNLGKAVQVGFNGYDAPLEYGCGPYWDGPDGYDPPSGDREELPFEGGQCPGVMYVWESQQLNNATCTLEDIQNSTPREGPISLVSTSEGNLQTIDGCQGRSYTSIFTAGTATFAVQRRGLPGSAPLVRWVRADGMPDECGNPEPVPLPRVPGNPPPGTGFGIPRDIGEPGDPFIVTPQPPEIGPDGPYFPIETPFGDVPYFPGNPDVESPVPPPSEGPPVDVAGGGEVDADPEDEVEGSVLLGYRFTVRDGAPQFQSVIPGTSPRIYSRVVGSLQLKLQGESGVFYSDNLQITSQEGSIVKQHPTLQVVGCVYNVLPNLAGLTLYEIRGKDDDS